jgi:hypothetical protein
VGTKVVLKEHKSLDSPSILSPLPLSSPTALSSPPPAATAVAEGTTDTGLAGGVAGGAAPAEGLEGRGDAGSDDDEPPCISR